MSLKNGTNNSKSTGQIIVVTSGKGGVGKTTTTASIGAALALKGKRVRLITGAPLPFATQKGSINQHA